MYDILAYLFENCRQADLAGDREGVAQKLAAAGFDGADISDALRWLGGMSSGAEAPAPLLPDARASFRAFAPRELSRLDAQCRGFLITLEQAGMLSAEAREQVIERCLAAPGAALTLEQLKLVVLMVLWNRRAPDRPLIARDVFASPALRRAS